MELKIIQPQQIHQLHERKDQRIAGLDEAGRGPLAGPVVAAACVLPESAHWEGVKDSKKLSATKREALFAQICSHSDVDYGIGIVDAERIDQINILRATLEAMSSALAQLKKTPDFILVDGLHLPTTSIPAQAIVKGDEKIWLIGAASILAKVTRDKIMEQYHLEYPQYNFLSHKGYGTAEHLALIHRFGPCPIHRKTFAPIKGIS